MGGVNLNKKTVAYSATGHGEGGLRRYSALSRCACEAGADPGGVVRLFWSGLFHLRRLHRADVCVGPDAGQCGFR